MTRVLKRLREKAKSTADKWKEEGVFELHIVMSALLSTFIIAVVVVILSYPYKKKEPTPTGSGAEICEIVVNYCSGKEMILLNEMTSQKGRRRIGR